MCLSEAKLIPIHDDKHSICEKCGTECFPSGEFKIQNCPFCRMEFKTDEKNPFSVCRQQHMSRSIGFLKDLTGHYHTFHYCHSTTLNQLQTWIEDLFGPPRKLQRLIFRGQSPPENLGTVLLPQETINLVDICKMACKISQRDINEMGQNLRSLSPRVTSNDVPCASSPDFFFTLIKVLQNAPLPITTKNNFIQVA